MKNDMPSRSQAELAAAGHSRSIRLAGGVTAESRFEPIREPNIRDVFAKNCTASCNLSHVCMQGGTPNTGLCHSTSQHVVSPSFLHLELVNNIDLVGHIETVRSSWYARAAMPNFI